MVPMLFLSFGAAVKLQALRIWFGLSQYSESGDALCITK